MQITGGKLYQLQIPLNPEVVPAPHHGGGHSMVLRLETDTGLIGYGEGLPETGEAVPAALEHIERVLWPQIAGHRFKPLSNLDDLSQFDRALGEPDATGALSPNPARCAAELALLDCGLRAQNKGLGEFLPPLRESVEYGGVIPPGDLAHTLAHVEKMTGQGLRHLKLPVTSEEDLKQLPEVLRVVDSRAGLRLHGGAAWPLKDARDAISTLEDFPIEAIEAPITRTTVSDLAAYKQHSPMPVCADHYLVTVADAEGLIKSDACDIFSLGLSKSGGIWRTWHIAQMALRAGLRLQVGARIGETAILSAAGRHLLAALPDVLFAEGSAGASLLAEDVTTDPVEFGSGGVAPLLEGPGFGITVVEEVLTKYAVSTTEFCL